MPPTDDIQRRGCRGNARVLLFIVIAAAIALGIIATYALIDRPARDVLTPAGANYNPGQGQDPAKSP